MPELPEVETVCRGLRELISDSDPIKEIQLVRRDLREPIALGLPRRFQGQCVQQIARRAKFILFETGNGTLVSHLGMSGTWRAYDGVSKKHDHIHIHFQSGKQMTYNDPRRFGLLFAIDPKTPEQSKWLRSLGVEPLSREFHIEYLKSKSQGRAVPVKNFLMDQKIVVGIGNIYASEVLFYAHVRPTRPANRLKEEEWRRVIQSTHKVLEQAIKNRGTTLRDYRQLSTEDGGFQNHLAVYGRDGESCSNCRAKVQHKQMSGRATYWCSRCQK